MPKAKIIDQSLQIAVISLPHSNKRWIELLKRIGIHSWDIERIWGIDGQLLKENQFEYLYKRGFIHKSSISWPKGQIGCALSHQKCWKKCLANKKPLLILEDDALLSNNWAEKLKTALKNLPEKDWDILLLGWNMDSCLEIEIGEGLSSTLLFRPRNPTSNQLQNILDSSFDYKWMKLSMGLGLAGYMVSFKGAKKLLEWSIPLRTLEIKNPELPSRECFSLDGQLNSFYKELNAWVLIPPLIAGANEKETSLTK